MKQYINQGSNDTRSGFGDGLTELGRTNPNVVALCADLIGSLKMQDFIDENPERFFQIGIAEANMMGIAAGLTIGGKIPFTGTFANFSTGRVYDQIRQSIAYSGKNVKICASHAGITLGEDGATHQILEDIGLMKMLPGMTVINTCDFNQTKSATIEISNFDGPVYLRFGRPKVANFTSSSEKFKIGKGLKLKDGNDVTIVATGHLVWEAIKASETSQPIGIRFSSCCLVIGSFIENNTASSIRSCSKILGVSNKLSNWGSSLSISIFFLFYFYLGESIILPQI